MWTMVKYEFLFERQALVPISGSVLEKVFGRISLGV